MNPQVKFQIASKDKIAEFIFDLRNSLDVENLSQRNNASCIRTILPRELVEEIMATDHLDNQLKSKIMEHISLPPNKEKSIQDFITKIQKYWGNEINDIFFSEMKNIFTGEFIQKEYICYITDEVVGAYFGENEVTLDWQQDIGLDKACFILAEEISHLIYWQVWKKLFNKDISDIDEIFSIKGKEWSCWNIAEIMPEYILVKNPTFGKFRWNKRKRYLGYPWIKKLEEELNPIWKDKKDIPDFIKEVHKKLGVS